MLYAFVFVACQLRIFYVPSSAPARTIITDLSKLQFEPIILAEKYGFAQIYFTSRGQKTVYDFGVDDVFCSSITDTDVRGYVCIDKQSGKLETTSHFKAPEGSSLVIFVTVQGRDRRQQRISIACPITINVTSSSVLKIATSSAVDERAIFFSTKITSLASIVHHHGNSLTHSAVKLASSVITAVTSTSSYPTGSITTLATLKSLINNELSSVFPSNTHFTSKPSIPKVGKTSSLIFLAPTTAPTTTTASLATVKGSGKKSSPSSTVRTSTASYLTSSLTTKASFKSLMSNELSSLLSPNMRYTRESLIHVIGTTPSFLPLVPTRAYTTASLASLKTGESSIKNALSIAGLHSSISESVQSPTTRINVWTTMPKIPGLTDFNISDFGR